MGALSAGRVALDTPLELPGTADTEAEVRCPWCTEKTGITLDPGSGPDQEYEEDCPVCCRPWRVSVRYDVDGAALVSLEREDD